MSEKSFASRARVQAEEELAARRRRLDAALASADARPDEVDVVDLIDLSLAVEQAETIVEELAEPPGEPG